MIFVVLLALIWLLQVPAMLAAEWPKMSVQLVKCGLLMLIIAPFALASVVVVPIALYFTAWEDDRLPWWARLWDNDVNINGDRPEYWDINYTGSTYYSDSHPRSRWARFVWLVLRNRASLMAQKLGHRWKPGEVEDVQTWGDPLTGRDHEGWVVNRRGPCWQYYMVKKLGPLCLRVNCGYKAWSNYDGRAVANVVYIPFSLLRWKGV